MGTITGISDLDQVRWPNSHWRSVKVCHDCLIHLATICHCLGNMRLCLQMIMSTGAGWLG